MTPGHVLLGAFERASVDGEVAAVRSAPGSGSQILPWLWEDAGVGPLHMREAASEADLLPVAPGWHSWDGTQAGAPSPVLLGRRVGWMAVACSLSF